MNRKKNIIYFVLCAVPVIAVLFILAVNNVLYLLLGIVVVLAVLVLLKQKKPELFIWMSRKNARPEPPAPPRPISEPAARVYMVLAEREAHGAQRITVNKATYEIGRGKDNDFVVEGPRIGRHHLRIEYDAAEDACYAVDMGSVNGTYLNSNKMKKGERYRLIQGDRLMIDDHAFAVEYAHY